MKKAVFAAAAACALVIGMAGCSPQVKVATGSDDDEQVVQEVEDSVDKSGLVEIQTFLLTVNVDPADDPAAAALKSASSEMVDEYLADGSLTQSEVDAAVEVLWDNISKNDLDKYIGAKSYAQNAQGGSASSPSSSMTVSQQNALRAAAQYLNVMPFSHDGLIEQLEFEGYSTEDATFAADNCGADWNRQAELMAQQYLDSMPFSHSGLVEQLVFEGFTQEQAEHGVASVGL